MHTLLQDLRYAFRMLIKRPGFTAVAVITLGLAIGVNTAIFSVVNTVLLSRLPYADPDRLVMLWMRVMSEGRNQIPVATAEFDDIREQNEVFEQIAAIIPDGYNLASGAEPIQISGARVSPNLFTMLGVRPSLGQVFSGNEVESGVEQGVILGDGLWRRQFGSDPNIIGKMVTVYQTPPYLAPGSTQRVGGIYTVIGVLPPDFQLPEISAEVWLPLALDRSQTARLQQRLRVVARLKQGVALDQARQNMEVIASRLEEKYPTNKGRTAWLVSLREQDIGGVQETIIILLVCALLVLLIACANVANLLLARTSEREREIALRLAIGASRRRVIQQLLTESVVLGLAGGALGLLIALTGTYALVAVGPGDIPRIKEVRIDLLVLSVTLAISILTGLIFGLAPALQASKPNMNETLKESTRSSSGSLRRNRIRSLLVVTEIVLSLTLLIGAGLIAKSFLRLSEVDPGFNPQHVLTMQVSLPSVKYTESVQQSAFFRQVLDRVGGLPGVQSAGVINIIPLMEYDQGTRIVIEGRPEPPPGEAPFVRRRLASHGFFSTLNIPVIEGREFTLEDTQSPKLIINETMARRFWNDESPIGKRIRLGVTAQGPWIPIVGVVRDIRQYLNTEPAPTYYLSDLGQLTMTLAVRTAASPESMIAPLRGEVLAVDKDQPVYDVMTMEQRVSNALPMIQMRFRTLLLMIFAVTALVLATVGIYGVISYSVTQRTQEIGIRMALGAQRVDVLRMVLSQGIILASVGVVIGLAASYALTRVISSLLFGVSATDITVFAGTALVLSAVAILASYIPARRATTVDPMTALRQQ